MREGGLRLGGPRDEHAHAADGSVRDAGLPEGRLANARFPFKEDSVRGGHRERAMNRIQLGVAADELLHDVRS
jgi:hypothetical protein